MNPTDANELVNRYLFAEEHEDLDALMELFAESVTIRNAANPADSGPGALERFLTSFWERTTKRTFDLVDAAGDDDGNVFAFADATLTFRKGAKFGPTTAVNDFTITVPIALRLHLDAGGRIDIADIFHETTTAARLAAGPATAS